MSNAEEKYTITFLRKDLERIYRESGIVADKNDSTIRTALAEHLMDSGFNGVNVKSEQTPQTLDKLKGVVEGIPVEKGFANPNTFKQSVITLIDEAINE